jgi:hypothetical protein
LRVITVNTFAPGVPIMVGLVIPVPHGKATSYITDAMEARVHEFDRASGEVGPH